MGCAALTPTVAQAESGFIPRASIAISQYQLTQDARPNSGVDFPELDFNVVFNMLGVGGTFYKDKYYMDIFLQHSDNQVDIFDENVGGLRVFEQFKGDRKDGAITFGMKVLDFRGSVYGGYKVGISEAAGDSQTTLRFEESGFFLGGNYSWAIGKGNLTVNIAVAQLDGKLEEKAPLAGAALGVNLDLDADSQATGVSYGVAWSAPISEKLTYSFSVDANSYTFDDVKDDAANDPPDELEEKFITAKLSFSYHF